MNEYMFPIVGQENRLPLYLVGVGKTEQNHVRFSGFPTFHFLYGARGAGTLIANGKKIRLAEKEGFLMFPNVPREYYAEEGIWETHWVTFDGYGAQQVLELLNFKQYTPIRLRNPVVVDSIISEMIINARTENMIGGLRNGSLVCQLIVELYESVNENISGDASSKQKQVQAVLDYIDAHFNRQISLDELVKIVQVSPQYLCRLFQGTVRMRPFAYITQRRLQEAKKLLMETDLSVKKIAEATGYNSASYFCSIFGKNEHMSPENFREMQRIKLSVMADKDLGASEE